MVVALATEAQMKYRGIYQINIYSCFFSLKREIFPKSFQFYNSENFIQQSCGFLDVANVPLTKFSWVKEDEIKIKMGGYM